MTKTNQAGTKLLYAGTTEGKIDAINKIIATKPFRRYVAKSNVICALNSI